MFDIPDLQGLQMKNWVTGRGFGFDGPLLTGGDNPIWMRWARMPLPIWTIAGLRIVFGSGMIAVNVAKSVLWSVPLILSFALIQRDCRTCLSSRAKWAAWGASVRIVIARRSRQSGDNVGRGGLYRIADRARHDDAPLSKQLGVGAQNGRVIFPGLLFGILIASIYLPKSSMIAVGIVMVIALSVVSRNLRLTLFAAIPLLLAMLCWGARTAAEGGEFLSARVWMDTTSTKGTIRPSSRITRLHFNMNIDPFYADIGVGHHYKSESDFDAGQEKEALQYMKTHPRATIIVMGRKIDVLLFL
jgi:hypothetical protein